MMDRSDRNGTEITRRKAFGMAAGAAVTGAVIAASRTGAETLAPNASEFAGKVLLITGGTSGIGKGTAERFANFGAKVFFCGRRRELGQQVQDAIRVDGGDATYMSADMREEQSVKAFVDGCVERYGRIDIAFNNAGVNGDIAARITTDKVENWDDVLNTNARGIWLAMKYQIPVMLAQGGGRIINTSSLLGMRAIPFIASYVASKHAVIGISHAAAAQHAADNIRINVIAPGPVDTPLLAKVHNDDPARVRHFIDGIPIGRIATADDIAGGVELLASEAGSYMHGTVLVLDGGKSYREYNCG